MIGTRDPDGNPGSGWIKSTTVTDNTSDPSPPPPEGASIPPAPRDRRLSPGTRLLLKLVGTYLVLSGVSGVMLVASALRTERTGLVDEVGKRGQAVTRLFVLSVAESLYAFDVESLIEWIHHLVPEQAGAAGLADIERVLIFDAKGRTITDGRKANPDLGEIQSGYLEVLKKPGAPPVVVTGDDRLSIRAPVRLHDRTLGGVQIEVGLSDVERRLDDSRRRMIYQVLLLVVLGLIPVWVITNYLIRPFFVGG